MPRDEDRDGVTVTEPAGSAVSSLRPGTVVEGLVIRTESGFHRVLVAGEILVCRAPKRLLMGERRTTTPVVIGDEVRALVKDDGTGVVQEILPRRSELIRGAAGGSRFLDVIAANLDLLVVVHSLREPDFNPARVDRFLVMAESAEVPALLCLNKVDLAPAAEAEDIAAVYRSIGYPVVLTCARTGVGIEEFRQHVIGHLSAVVGPSGVGKSSLLNRVQPGLALRTGEISESTGKGRHTTTTAELLALAGGGYIADTPGLRELAIREVEQQDPAWLFPEFRQFMTSCRFSNCTHREEIGCAVKAAVERGEIEPERYYSFRRIFEEIAEQDRLALRS